MELRFLRVLVMVLAVAVCTGVVCGDTWMAPPETRTVWALDRTAKAVVSSGRDAGWEMVPSRITVWQTEPNKPDNLVWEGKLINIPHEIYVSSQAKSVVTMDKWGRIGQDALVFYGPKGQVIRHYTDAKELLNKKEIPRIKQTISSFWWNEEGHAGLTADGDHFLLWLAWGRLLVFESSTGKEVEVKTFLRESRSRKAAFDTVDILTKSKKPDDRIKAVRFAGRLGGKESLQILREFMKDPYYRDGSWKKMDDTWQRFGRNYYRICPRSYPVRKAAAEELHIGFGQADGVIMEWIAR